MPALVAEILTLLPQLIAAGIQVDGLVQRIRDVADPTDTQWAGVNAELDRLTAQLNKDP